MNRLSPLIVRRADFLPAELAPDWSVGSDEASTLLEDLKLFATGWLGGFVFLGTFLA